VLGRVSWNETNVEPGWLPKSRKPVVSRENLAMRAQPV
jgi:hypothetical protein